MDDSTKHAREHNRSGKLTSLMAIWALRSWEGKMSPTKRLVLYAILAHFGEECDGFASYNQLAQATGLNRRTIISTIPELLEDAGPFVLTTYPRGEQKAHGYRIKLKNAEESKDSRQETSPGVVRAFPRIHRNIVSN